MTATSTPVLVGRSSSHFTRLARLFAHELNVAYDFRVVRDLTSRSSADYADNPSLRIPIMLTESGSWFGALNICRELARRAEHPPRLVWPEDLTQPVAANAQELTFQAMSTEVVLIMAKATGVAHENPYIEKLRASLANSLAWLDAHVDTALNTLPGEPRLSTLEVSLFCLITHLDFREVLSTAPYPRLNAFQERFATRSSATRTRYHFDP